jgi:hypothetical protein
MMMNPGFITTYDAIQKVINFTVEPLQKTTAEVLAVALMSFRQMFGYPPCRNFAEQKNVIHERIGHTFTDTQL